MSELTHLTHRLANAVGDYRTAASVTVDQLAHPVDVIEGDLPVSRLELLFRSPHVQCVAVREDDERTGLITRRRFDAAMSGRLGFGRAILSRRESRELTDFAPLVVRPDAPVSEVAVRAMERRDERRYDDVLVLGEVWQAVSAADLVRSLSTQLAVRSLHDPLTGLPHRSMFWHLLGRRCAAVVGTPQRVVVAVADLRGFAQTNAVLGQAGGDAVLAAVGAALRGALPELWDVARLDGDEFAVAVTVPGAADERQADVIAGEVVRAVHLALAEPPAGLDARVWPVVDVAGACSGAGAADPDRLVGLVQARLRSSKVAAAASS